MNGTQPGRNATIHSFPAGGRSRNAGIRHSTSTVIRPVRFAPVIIAESGWYHDEAMREEARLTSDSHKPN